jgi:hypothetical protein
LAFLLLYDSPVTQWHIKYDCSLERVFITLKNISLEREESSHTNIPEEATRKKARL